MKEMQNVLLERSNRDIWQAPRWYQALTITERLSTGDGPVLDENGDMEAAKKRFQRWQSSETFQEEAAFAQRLAADGLTEEGLLALLAESSEALQARLSPDAIASWLQELEIAFTSPPQEDMVGSLWEKVDDSRRQSMQLLLHPLRPLLLRGIERLRSRLRRLVDEHQGPAIDEDALLSCLIHTLSNQVLQLITPTLVLELHVFRLQDRLEGETESARFQSFIERLETEEEILALLSEYTVLARLLVECIRTWEEVSLELFERLFVDWQEIAVRFSAKHEWGVLCRIQSGVGDTHCGGRSVSLLEWDSGFRLVYKPKSLALDAHMHQLIEWLNSFGPSLRLADVLDKGSYGWTEYIRAASCSSVEEVQRFYERQGAYLALFYAFGATDFHSENIIAAGEYPVPVDLECLFQPALPGSKSQSVQNVAALLQKSVLRTGILPQRFHGAKPGEGIDISGLGGRGGQLTPMPIPFWEDVGTDQMRLEKERQPITERNNRPRLNDKEVDLLAYTTHLLQGFTSMYRLLLEQVEPLCERFLPLFTSDTIRMVLRGTAFYMQLVRGSYHPNLLRNALQRDRFLNFLWAGNTPGYPAAVLLAERADIVRGDVPFFSTRVESCDLYTSQGVCIPDFFTISGLEETKKRLQRLSEDDLKRQSWLITASVASMAPQVYSRRIAHHSEADGSLVTREDVLTSARQIGDELNRSAWRIEERAGWVTVEDIDHNTRELGACGINLYSGKSGIIFFLAYLASLTGEEGYRHLADAALEMLFIDLQQSFHLDEQRMIGAFSGAGSLVYLYSHLGWLWQDPSFFTRAEELLPELLLNLEKDESLDIIAGAAGGILALLSLFTASGLTVALEGAIACGEYLLRRATVLPEGRIWKGVIGERPLTGFSHGAAGFAWSLHRLAQESGEQRFQQAALEALQYERNLFSPVQQNWPDFRHDAAEPEYEISWCHGAAGIGLSRLGMLRSMKDPELHQEIRAALPTTLRAFGGSHLLCHGSSGNLETLHMAAHMLPDEPQWGMHVRDITKWLLEDMKQHGWDCGLPLGVFSPSLMVGISGIGYQLLRLAAPERVPAVLLLDPPLMQPGPFKSLFA